MTGISQSHTGVEVELSGQIHPMLRIDMALGLGNWVFTDDASGTYRDDNSDVSYGYALKDLKVGDMPQTAYVGGLTLKPIDGLSVQGLYRWYDNCLLYTSDAADE